MSVWPEAECPPVSGTSQSPWLRVISALAQWTRAWHECHWMETDAGRAETWLDERDCALSVFYFSWPLNVAGWDAALVNRCVMLRRCVLLLVSSFIYTLALNADTHTHTCSDSTTCTKLHDDMAQCFTYGCDSETYPASFPADRYLIKLCIILNDISGHFFKINTKTCTVTGPCQCFPAALPLEEMSSFKLHLVFGAWCQAMSLSASCVAYCITAGALRGCMLASMSDDAVDLPERSYLIIC